MGFPHHGHQNHHHQKSQRRQSEWIYMFIYSNDWHESPSFWSTFIGINKTLIIYYLTMFSVRVFSPKFASRFDFQRTTPKTTESGGLSHNFQNWNKSEWLVVLSSIKRSDPKTQWRFRVEKTTLSSHSQKTKSTFLRDSTTQPRAFDFQKCCRKKYYLFNKLVDISKKC